MRLKEQKKRIYNVGATQLDDIYNKRFKKKSETFNYFNLDEKKDVIISIFHPVTDDQENNIFDRHPKKDSPKKLINDQLTKTKNNIYPWKELPLYLHDRKNKTNWFDTNINLVDED